MDHNFANNIIDPEIKRLLAKIPDEDLADLLALHGCGSIERQVKARFNRFVAKHLGGLIFFGFLALTIIAVIWKAVSDSSLLH